MLLVLPMETALTPTPVATADLTPPIALSTTPTPSASPTSQSAPAPAGPFHPALQALTVRRPASPPPAGGARRWLFGAAPLGAHERQDLALLNVGSRRAHVWITLISAAHRVLAYVQLEPWRVRRLSLNDLLDPADAVAVEISSDVGIVAERVAIHANAGDEGTAGAVTPGWTPPEAASTQAIARAPVFTGERQQLTLFNPGEHTTGALVRSLGPAGGTARAITLGPGAARVLLTGQAPAGVVVVPRGGPLLAEESTSYRISNGLTGLRATAPAPQWYFAPTPLRTGGHSYLTLLNPNPVALTATLAELGPGGDRPVVVAVPAGAERIVEPARLLPRHAFDRWLVLQAGAPLVASRVTVLPPGGEKGLARYYVGSLASPGTAAPSRRIAFAAGDTRTLFTGIRETLFVANPGPHPATVRLTYVTAGGPSAAQGLRLAPGAAATLFPASLVGAVAHGALLEASAPIAAVMLWQFNAGVFAAESRGVDLDAPGS